MSISPDEKWMATSGSGGAFLWDYQTGTMLRRLEAHHRRVLALCFSRSGVLLTGGGDAVTRAWNVESGTEWRSFVGHIGEIFDLSFAPDGQSFVSVGDSTVRIWSFNTDPPGRFSTGFKAAVKSAQVGRLSGRLQLRGNPGIDRRVSPDSKLNAVR